MGSESTGMQVSFIELVSNSVDVSRDISIETHSLGAKDHPFEIRTRWIVNEDDSSWKLVIGSRIYRLITTEDIVKPFVLHVADGADDGSDEESTRKLGFTTPNASAKKPPFDRFKLVARCGTRAEAILKVLELELQYVTSSLRTELSDR